MQYFTGLRVFGYSCLAVSATMLATIPAVADDDGDVQGAPVEDSRVEKIVRDVQKSIVVVTVTGRDGKTSGVGSGFVVSPDGLLATNLHVIGEARPISVQFVDGRKFDVTSVHATDRQSDLALIRIPAKDLPALKLGDSDELRQGQRVVALGNPLGLKHSVVEGIVSGKREVDGRRVIQLAIPVEPGNSGGPVVDLQGNVHGILTMKSLLTRNLGFAVEVNSLKPLIARPNPVPMSRWLTIGALDASEWTTLFGARWKQRSGHILVSGQGEGFGGRSLCLSKTALPERPFEMAVSVRLDDESGAAGLVFHSDGSNRHYGFYPSGGGLRLSRFDGPDVFSWKVLHEVSSEHYQPGDWNHLKVRFEKDKTLCFVNDRPVIESTDGALTTGSVGLAKFRHTSAEFKQFQVARTIAPQQVSSADAKAVNERIERLPSRDQRLPPQLTDLARESTLSRTVLAQRVEQLRSEAAQLEQLSRDIHVMDVTTNLAKLLSDKDEDVDLAHAALLVARLDDDEIEVAAYLKEIKRMASEIKQKLPAETDDSARLEALNEYLFTENGFHGSRTDYYHKANSYLNQVIDDREGLPITLSVLYMELGRRVGLNLVGVGLPGHFVVRHEPRDGEAQLIDVFDGGTTLTRDAAAQKVRENTGSELRDEHLQANDKPTIIVRMLRNLLGIAQKEEDKEAMLRYLNAIVTTDPQSVEHRGMRAVIRHETGRRRAALSDIDWILEKKPAGLDLDRIRQLREFFLHGRR